MKMKNLKNNDTLVGLIVFLIGVYIFIESMKLLEVGEYYDSPGLLPVIISVVIIVSSVFLMWNGLKGELKGNKKIESKKDFNIKKKPLLNLRIVIIISLISLYIVALSYTSFLIASIIFLFIIMCYLKSANLFKITIISIIIPILIQFIFKNIFNQLLP